MAQIRTRQKNDIYLPWHGNSLLLRLIAGSKTGPILKQKKEIHSLSALSCHKEILTSLKRPKWLFISLSFSDIFSFNCMTGYCALSSPQFGITSSTIIFALCLSKVELSPFWSVNFHWITTKVDFDGMKSFQLMQKSPDFRISNSLWRR